MAALYRSSDGGTSWSSTPSLGGIDGEALTYEPNTDALYYGQNFAGIVYKSIDHGVNWNAIGTQNPNVTLCSLGVSPDASHVLIAGSESGVLDRSTDEGSHWIQVYPTDTVKNPEVPKVIFSGFAPSVALAARWHSLKESLVMTSDRGATWSAIASPDPHVWALELDQRRESCPNGKPLHLWTGLFTQNAADTTAGGLIEESTDGGSSWHTTGFPRIPIPPSVWVLKHDTASGTLAAATDSGVFIGHEPGLAVSAALHTGSEFSFYPNPASKSATLAYSGNELKAVRLQVSSVTGELLFDQKLSSSSHQIDISEWPNGVYFARVQTQAGELFTARLVIFRE